MRKWLLFVCGTLSLSATVFAADWPQWRGPERTGVSKETGLLQEWPKGGPPLLWTNDNMGLGFSSPSVVGDKLYTLGARGGKTYVLCLDVKMGQEQWACEIGPMFTFQGNVWGDGPRSTPTVDGENIYVLGGHGDLACVTTAGKLVWKKNLEKDLGGEMMSDWGYSHSVLIDGDKLICMPGGPKGTVAALDKKTGNVVWRSTELKDKATYSSPMVAEFGGVRQYVVMTYIDDTEGGSVAGVAAKDGKLLWYQPFFSGQSYAVSPTPIIKGDEVFVSAGYGAGSQVLKIVKNGDSFKAEPQYNRRVQKKSIKNRDGGVVNIGDFLYAHSEDFGWVCQEWKTGKLRWEEPDKLEGASGSIIAADNRLYLYSDSGVAVIIEPNPKAWVEHGRFEIPKKSGITQTKTGRQSKVWTHPVIANGRLYLRDHEYLFCYDIRAKK